MNLRLAGLTAWLGVVIAGAAAAQRPAAVEGLERLKALAGEWEAPGPDGASPFGSIGGAGWPPIGIGSTAGSGTTD